MSNKYIKKVTARIDVGHTVSKRSFHPNNANRNKQNLFLFKFKVGKTLNIFNILILCKISVYTVLWSTLLSESEVSAYYLTALVEKICTYL